MGMGIVPIPKDMEAATCFAMKPAATGELSELSIHLANI